MGGDNESSSSLQCPSNSAGTKRAERSAGSQVAPEGEARATRPHLENSRSNIVYKERNYNNAMDVAFANFADSFADNNDSGEANDDGAGGNLEILNQSGKLGGKHDNVMYSLFDDFVIDSDEPEDEQGDLEDTVILEDSIEEIFESIFEEEEIRAKRSKEDHENNLLHDYFEPEDLSSGVEEHEWIRMADGSSKMAKDIVAGDFVLDRYGVSQQVEGVQAGWSELYEVSRNSTALTYDIFGHQKAVVGGSQPFKVTVKQRNLNPCPRLGGENPGYQVTYRELVHESLIGRNGETRSFPKARKTSTMKTYYAGSAKARTSQLAANAEQAKAELRDKVDAKIPRKSDGEAYSEIRWSSELRDLVLYQLPRNADKLDEAERRRISANIDSINPKSNLRRHNKIAASIFETRPGQLECKCPQRKTFEEMASHYIPESNLDEFWYLAGTWVGDGFMQFPFIAVDSKDSESMKRFAVYAEKLGLDCDIDYGHLPQDILEKYWGPQNKKRVTIQLTHQDDDDRKKLSVLLEHTKKTARLAEEWEKNQNSARKVAKERGEPELPAKENPHRHYAAQIAIHDGYIGYGRNMTTKNWLWRLFLASGIRGEMIKDEKKVHTKTAPEWLITAPVSWRESFLAGLTESKGYKSKWSKEYGIATVYEELCMRVVAIARSLGISAWVHIREAKVYRWADETNDLQKAYFIRFGGDEALFRVMSRVATPRKKPDERSRASDENWQRSPEQFRFAATPLHKKGRVIKLRLRNSFEYVLACGMLMMAEGAERKAEGWSDRANVPRFTNLQRRKCAGCSTHSDNWYPSWDNEKAKLCYSCSKRYRKHRVHCTECGFVPSDEQWELIKKNERVSNQGEPVFACPNCSQPSRYTLVQKRSESETGKKCICCEEQNVARFLSSWDPEKKLCDTCGVRWKRIGIHCDCGNVPFKAEVNKAQADEQGRKSFDCSKCQNPIIVTDEGNMCISCQKLVTNAWCRSWNGEEGKLCVTCSKRYESHKVYCKNCNFVPYDAEIRKGLACTKCTPKTACISCEATESAQWLPSWDPDQKLCQACGTRYEKRKSYCSECRFVPYCRQTQCKCANPAACISCMRSCSADWESWSSTEGKLCGICAARFCVHKSHCTGCGFIPPTGKKELTKKEYRKLNGEIVSCPSCSSATFPCISCSTIRSISWHQSPIGKGKECNWCHLRYEEHGSFCQDCGYIPLSEEVTSDCPRYECTGSIQKRSPSKTTKKCMSCHQVSLGWTPSWDNESGQLCPQCGDRYKHIEMYCDVPYCHFVPFQYQIKKAGKKGLFNCLQCGKRMRKKEISNPVLSEDDNDVAQDPQSVAGPTPDSSNAGRLQAGSEGRKAGNSGPCIACGITETIRWRPSWDSKQGVLCNACGNRHMKHPVHCTLCGFIPNNQEWEKMKYKVKDGEQGEQLFPCPTCSRQAGGDEHTVVWAAPPEKDSPRICLSCGESNTSDWHQSWVPGQKLCNPCGLCWKKTGVHCDCNYVPFKSQLNKAPPDEQGNQTIKCSKCEKGVTVHLPNFTPRPAAPEMKCLSCHGTEHRGWRRSWNNDVGKLCVACNARYETFHDYCKKCMFVPYSADFKKGTVDQEGNKTFKCRKCDPPDQEPSEKETVCLSCHRTSSSQWVISWQPDRRLCGACGSRYRKHSAYCPRCNFVLYPREPKSKHCWCNPAKEGLNAGIS